MKLNAVIKVYGDPNAISACFKPELMDRKRANFKIIEKEDYVLFEIETKDSAALRATFNGITKLLTVYEKLEGV
ncbi:hypothetical protein GOV06_05680 [Candidatus Woesearchaeota archaeon]|nr:hypothetical protein [Candidatus Woesearchaeota archaeon]